MSKDFACKGGMFSWNHFMSKNSNQHAGKMLGDLLARIHGDGGHYAAEHGIEKAVADADRILAEWRAYKPAPPQQGEYLPLPEGWPARFRCDSCEGNGEVGEPMYQGYFQPPEKARCPECSGVGWSSEEQAYNTDQVHAAIDADRASRGAAQAAPAPVAEDAEDAANWKWLAAYLVGPRTDRDDEIVASESVNALRKLVSAARAPTAHPAQEARLNPDMPVQEFRLHMGELTADEVLVARAAIRWANSQKEAREK